MNRTEISQLGEFGLIDRLAAGVKKYQPTTQKGIGDDAAVIASPSANELYLMTADMLVEGVHFDLTYCPLQHLGYKAIAVNVSDIAAMNGIPRQATLSIGISNRFSVEALEALYEGVNLACQQYHLDLVGGDTCSTKGGLVLSVSVLGSVGADKVTYRSGAVDNDIVCVTGDLGGAYLGLQLLEREKKVFLDHPDMQPELAGKDYIIGRQLKPEARTDWVYELLEFGVVPTAMIDVSDGLASEIMHLCKNSGIGAVLFEDKLPIHEMTYQTALDFQISPTTAALNGGEDYELLFTVKQTDYKKIEKHPQITAIGYMTHSQPDAWLHTRNDQRFPIQAQGWVHF